MNFKDQIAVAVADRIRENGLFLVEVKTLPGKIVVFIDHPESGVKLEDCINLSRYLQQHPDISQVFEKNELEVSSPGMDEPLKVLPQYKKRLGQRIHVITFDGMKREGVLLNAADAGIELEESTEKRVNGKKEIVTVIHNIPFTQIKETKLHYSIDKLLK